MAPFAAELANLRALTFRITSTTTVQLPQHVPAIATSLANCRSLLSSTQSSNSKSSSEAAVAIHKYRTLLSTLLQDRTIQGRWSAIVLIKATIEIGGWETLQKALPWVRGLLGILTKPDPPSAKKLSIITLTRIFILTREYPTLVREITTPSLPAFVQSCLQMASAKASASLLHTILESFNQLVPRHPTIFRSYQKQLQPLLGQILAPTPSSNLAKEKVSGLKLDITSEVSDAARRLHVQLPCCAPKGGSSDEWQKSLKNTVLSVHRTADKVFRAVVEDWQSSVLDRPSTSGQTLENEVQDMESNTLSLPPWSGIFAGGERLVHLLHLLREYLENSTPNPVGLDVALIMDLLTRFLSLTVPSSAGAKSFQAVKFNNQATKEERENLWLVLPSVHVATIELLLVLVERSGASTAALDSILLDQLVWVFNAEKYNAHVKTACYQAFAKILTRSGVGLTKSAIDPLSSVIRICCDDLLPSGQPVAKQQPPAQGKANGNAQQGATNADSFLNTSKDTTDKVIHFAGLQQAAYQLLPALLKNVPAQFFSDSLRTRMDRTATLIQHKDAMVASVLNPPPSKRFGKPAASILPLMARSFASDTNVESLMRPRMPVIRLGTQDTEPDDAIEEEEEADEDVEEEQEEPFVGQELDSLLETAAKNDNAPGDIAMVDVPPEESVPEVAPPLVPTPTATVSPPLDVNASGKRPQHETVPLSPTKRMKVDKEEVEQTIASSTPITVTTRSSKRISEMVVAPEVPAPSPAVAAPQAAETKAEESDDDDDDIQLVMGHDTDDESDS